MQANAAVRYLVVLGLVVSFVALSPLPAVRAADQVVTKADDSGPGTLRQAIADVHEGGTITFDLPVYVTGIVLASDELLIDKSMTISGPGADDLFVSGGNQYRVFDIISGTVTISGLTIKDGRVIAPSARGGGIYNAGDLTLQQVTVKDNLAQGVSGGGRARGGGIANYGSLVVEDSLIAHNWALGGTGPSPSGGGLAFGGGIFAGLAASLTLRGSTLESNKAIGGDDPSQAGPAMGGGIYGEVESGVTAEDTDLDRNSCTGGESWGGTAGQAHGGGIAMEAPTLLIIEGGNLTYNEAHGGDGTIRGGGYGGAVSIGATAVLSATDVTLSNNETHGAPANGGAIYNAGMAALSGSILNSNMALARMQGMTGSVAQGAALSADVDSTTTISACELKWNQARGGEDKDLDGTGGEARGGAIRNRGDLTLSDSIIEGGRALGGSGEDGGGHAYGGGVYSSSPGTAAITDTMVEGCIARGGSGDADPGGGWAYGGGASFKGAAIIEACSFSKNNAQGGDSADAEGGSGHGGGLWTDDVVTIQRSAFLTNTAEGGIGETAGGAGYGGGVTTGYRTQLSVSGCLFAYNLAEGGAGISGDHGLGLGGGLKTEDKTWDVSEVTVLNSTFGGNEVRGAGAGQGGGIHATPATTLTLSFCTIVNNKAQYKGGGIHSATGGAGEGPILKNSIVGGNSAANGPQLSGSVQSRGHNLVEDLAGANYQVSPLPNTGEGNLTGPPGTGPLQDNGGPTWTHALLNGVDPSLAVDAASATDIQGQMVSVDQRGFLRPAPSGGEHDMGAYEWREEISGVYLPFVVKR